MNRDIIILIIFLVILMSYYNQKNKEKFTQSNKPSEVVCNCNIEKFNDDSNITTPIPVEENIGNDLSSIFQNFVDTEYSNIFPIVNGRQANRNAAGFAFFKYFYDTKRDTEEMFKMYNQFYCAVSGSIVGPRENNNSIIPVKKLDGSEIVGKYYRCCTPCLCDIMRYVRVVPTTINFNDGSSTSMNLLTIGDPCSNESQLPNEVDNSVFQCSNGLSQNAYRVNSSGEITTSEGRMIIGVLYEGEGSTVDAVNICTTGQNRICQNPDELQWGMGDIFVKVAIINSDSNNNSINESVKNQYCN